MNTVSEVFELCRIEDYLEDGRIDKITYLRLAFKNEKVFEYRASDKIYFERNYVNGELTEYFKYGVDSKGNRTHYYQFDKNDKEVYRQIRKYNDKNLNIELYSQNEYGKEMYLSQKYSYNTKNQLIRIEDLNDDGSVAYWEEINYDNSGRQTKCEIKNIDGTTEVVSKSIYHDDRKEEKLFKNGRSQVRYYNDESLIVLEEEFNKGQLTNKLKYEYKKSI